MNKRQWKKFEKKMIKNAGKVEYPTVEDYKRMDFPTAVNAFVDAMARDILNAFKITFNQLPRKYPQ